MLCLYANNTFVVYDSDRGTSLWRRCISTDTDFQIRSFQMDPFNDQNVVLSLANTNQNHSECCFARVGDLFQKTALTVYQIYLANCEETSLGSPKNQLNASSSFLQRYVTTIGHSLSRNSLAFLNVTHLLEYLKIVYHASNLDQILVVFEREIHLIDLRFKQVICVIRVENNCGNISDLYSCWQRNAIVCLHQNGSISYRVMQKKRRRKEHIGTDVMELAYVPIAISDGLRLTKYNKIFGFEVNRINETEIYLISNNEKINVYRLYSPDLRTANDHLLTLTDYVQLDDETNGGHRARRFNLIMAKYFNCISKGRHVMRTGPHLIYKNWFYHRPLVAIGDSNGVIQIFNLATNQLEKQYSVHSVVIRGIEWVNLNVLLSYAYGNNGTKLCNELKITDVNTGYSVLIREERNNESGPIEILKVSHFKNYFIITFKNDPFEIWDLKNLCCLKQMTALPANITSVEWIPISKDPKGGKNASRSKEYFMITNSDSELYHFCVEGSNVKKILSTPHLSGGITATAWKNDQLIFGDSDGNITLWNLRTKVSKAECTLRGPIRKFSFGPGKSYLKLLVLFSDGVDLWNIKEMKLEAQIKYPRDIEFRVDDIDWASIDRPMLLTPEGFLLISDSKLKVFHSAMNFNSLTGGMPISDDSGDDSAGDQCRFDYERLGRINYQVFSNENKLKISSDLINDQLLNMPELDYVEKSLLLAKLLGRLDMVQFFELVKHYAKPGYRVDTFFENFVENEYFKEMQRDKIAIYELKRTRQEHNEICNELHLYLGNDQRTVQLLLETETSLKNLYLKDSLKACLISLLLQSEKNSTNLSHPVIKLVATNLIANESTDEGIQLLFIIGKIIDACRYLQSNNSWKKSLFLSKVRDLNFFRILIISKRLSLIDFVSLICFLFFYPPYYPPQTNLAKDEFIDVNSRWPDYLSACKKDKDKLFALVSLEMHEKVINYLMDRNEFKFASLYCDICIEQRLVDRSLYNLFKKVYQRYEQFLADAKLAYLIPSYQHRINFLEEKVDRFKLDVYQKDLVEAKNRRPNLPFAKGYLTAWNELDVLSDAIVEEDEDEDIKLVDLVIADDLVAGNQIGNQSTTKSSC